MTGMRPWSTLCWFLVAFGVSRLSALHDSTDRSAQFTLASQNSSSTFDRELGVYTPLTLLECARICFSDSDLCAGFYYDTVNSSSTCALLSWDTLYPVVNTSWYTSWQLFALTDIQHVYPSPETPLSSGCNYTYIEVLGLCISLYTDAALTWENAWIHCSDMAGDLLDFASASEFLQFRDFAINANALNTWDWHIGLKWVETDGEWRWNKTGYAEFDLSIWDVEEPTYSSASTLCASMSPWSSFYLEDNSCTQYHSHTLCKHQYILK